MLAGILFHNQAGEDPILDSLILEAIRVKGWTCCTDESRVGVFPRIPRGWRAFALSF